jgi:two-component sensor histidine kinase
MFSKLLNIGISEEIDIYQKRETKALNLFSLFALAGLIIGATNIIFLGSNYAIGAVSFTALGSILVLILNHYKYYQAATYTFVIYINLSLFFLNSYYPYEAGSYLYYFPEVFCIALLHNPNKTKIRDIVFFLIIASGFFGSRFFNFSFIPKAALDGEQSRIIFAYNINFCAALTIILVYLVIGVINKQYSELTQLLEKSKKDQVLIQSSLKEKEVLLAEIQHRVKNNLSVIIGLFNLQISNSPNEQTRQAINEARNRVLSIAMVHERLYKKENLSRINLKPYISELAKEVVRSHPLHPKIDIMEELDDLDADITKAVPIGLVVNEVITNSLKHAFSSDTEKPSIKVMLTAHFGLIAVKIHDNGKGFPANIERSERSLGLSLIESLAQQIDGSIHMSNSNGAVVKLTFPI